MSIYFSDEAQTRAAHVINYTRLTNTTRRTLTNSTSNNEHVTCDFGNVNKKESGSLLCFQGFIAGWGNESGAITLNLKVGSTHANYITSGGTGTGYPIAHYNYVADGYYKLIVISGHITGYTGTGNQNILIGHRSANGSSAKPFQLLNPNASDDARIENSMGGSSLSIWEILQ